MLIAKYKNYNYLFYILILISILYLIVTVLLSVKQDKVFKDDYQNYIDAESKFKTGKNTEALNSFVGLTEKYPNNYTLLWETAVVYANNGNIKMAKKYFASAKKQHPFIVNDTLFDTQYGSILFDSGEPKEAKKYFIRAQLLNKDQDKSLSDLLNKMLKEIESK